MLSITRIVWISLFFTSVAHAQVQEEIRRCASIGADAERLACYDRLFRDSNAAASRTTASAPLPVASSAPAPATATATAAGSIADATPDGEFGANPRLQEEQRRRERESQGSEGAQELRVRIKKVDLHPYGLHVITLENGQVWQQREKVWELELKPGDEIVIRRGMLGSYRLQLEGQRVSSSVMRVK